ncbi:MAG: hypothetical protein COX19_15860 [Desulfobacterales bacterium CG23_combo_of_CG06-09_8_20_14_all_51_8]|nr:MAG: hypothetical protein COX19_15860 [Desulfobacterales bacterium CG23_combo_of_CG06-09_8_20_14_all_51_8]
MSIAAKIHPRAFAIEFKDLATWSVAAQFVAEWNWPQEVIKPLGRILKRRSEAALETLSPETMVTLLTIRFDGSIEPREQIQIKGIKGRLFRVYPGDVIFSKIDVRNGAIGLARDDIDCMCVTSEFPVYSVNIDKVLPEYVKLLFRTTIFKKLLNSMISGASGRKRIQPSHLERVIVPIPPLRVQQKIVAYWSDAQSLISAIKRSIETIQNDSEKGLLKRIGLQIPPVIPRKGCFTINLSQNERWDTFFFRKDFISLDDQIRSANYTTLGDSLNFISRAWKPSDFPKGSFEYIEISSVTKNDGITHTRSVSVQEAPSRATTLVKAGDLIIATTRPYLGSFTIVGKKHDGFVCSSGFSLAESLKTEALDKEFILFFLKSEAGLRQLERRMSGGLYPAIVQSELEKILIPTPPLKVQKEVVAAYNNGLAEIQRLRIESKKISEEAGQQIEEMILGVSSVEDI